MKEKLSRLNSAAVAKIEGGIWYLRLRSLNHHSKPIDLLQKKMLAHSIEHPITKAIYPASILLYGQQNEIYIDEK